MKKIYKEEEFYKDEGWPSESFIYCSYIFYTGEINEYGNDYDQFAFVENAEYPYIRLTKKRESSHFPCGLSSCPATDGWYASLSEDEREEQFPKIAWGFAAEFLANLRYDNDIKDYVEKKERSLLINDYYNKYLRIYLESHNGLKFAKVTLMQKELDFLTEHETVIKKLWGKSTPLKKYSTLYDYAREAELEYENFLYERKIAIMKNEENEGKNPPEKSVYRETIQNGEKSVYIENHTGSIIIELPSI